MRWHYAPARRSPDGSAACVELECTRPLMRSRSNRGRVVTQNLLTMTSAPDGRQRVIIEGISPQIDGGRYAIKRVVGEDVVVEADVFADGHDVLSAVLRYRHREDADWTEIEMTPLVNDRWQAVFRCEKLGEYVYRIEAWVDHFKSWRRDIEKKAKAGQDIAVDLLYGVDLVKGGIARSPEPNRPAIQSWLASWERGDSANANTRLTAALDSGMASLVQRAADRSLATHFPGEFRVIVDPVRARFGSWYELFPRSCGSDGKRHGTFRDVEAELPRVAEMGFDVLYLPPIHPIGEPFRKGRNNSAQAQPDDPGSPWAIGGKAGGHKAVHPELGTIGDFRRLVARAREFGIQLALDIAFQCSPDHPYVREHPEWFKKRPDGTIQYAENPPKKYQDIYPFDFETPAWKALWQELKSVIEFWIHEGVTIFRVDNPHTKAFPFWEWVINELKATHPELIFLSEAFTRPKVMYNLAKLGFTQSYNYFPWRNTAAELRQFMTELTRTNVKEFYRPNLWPNTPDILPQFLQFGGRPGFMIRVLLASTLGASYGIYGPAYELGVNAPLAAGGEEYRDSEKYELKAWKLESPDSIQPLITRLNAIRRDNPALQSNELLAFHEVDNDQLLVYSKRTPDRNNLVLVAVNVDPHHAQSGHVTLALDEFGIGPEDTFQAHDLLTDQRYLWRGPRAFISLDPQKLPGAVFNIRRRVRTERDFDYFM